MKMSLAENIRRFRKERSLTQEQLSEALGVTAGAVYKWEAKLSIPELELIVQMADFFDTSVDVLLGYEVKDNRLGATVKRLQEYRRSKEWDGLADAEMALKKYPHSFQIVHESAALYGAFGFERRDKVMLRRALELTEKSLSLLPQNTDPEISEQTLYGKMAEIYLGLGETDRAVELWKTHNAGCMNSHYLGHILAQTDRLGEAEPFLSEAMAKILRLGIDLFSGLRRGDRPNFLDKISAVMLAALAWAQFMSGQEGEARRSLHSAKELAAFFDAAPSYDESDIRFIGRIEGASAHDDMGATALEAVHHAVSEFDNEAFSALWSEIEEE